MSQERYLVEAKVGPAWYKQMGPSHSFALTREEKDNLVKQLRELKKRPQTNIERIRVTKLTRKSGWGGQVWTRKTPRQTEVVDVKPRSKRRRGLTSKLMRGY